MSSNNYYRRDEEASSSGPGGGGGNGRSSNSMKMSIPRKKKRLSITMNSGSSYHSSVHSSNMSRNPDMNINTSAYGGTSKGSSLNSQNQHQNQHNARDRGSTSMTSISRIPRKNKPNKPVPSSMAKPIKSSSSFSTYNAAGIQIKTETPFTIAIPSKQISKEIYNILGKQRYKSYNSSNNNNNNTSKSSTSRASTEISPSSRLRSSNRGLKRRSYTEMKETDSDFLETDSENENEFNDNDGGAVDGGGGTSSSRLVRIKKKKLMKKKKLKTNDFFTNPNSIKEESKYDFGATENNDHVNVSSTATPIITTTTTKHETMQNQAPSSSTSMIQQYYDLHTQPLNMEIPSPPPGTLSSLFYSHESLLHVWAIDKIIGWKTRPKISLMNDDANNNNDDDPSKKVEKEGVEEGLIKPNEHEMIIDNNNDSMDQPKTNHPEQITHEKAIEYSDKLINHFISNKNKRMEISRINQKECPMVIKAFCEKEKRNRRQREEKEGQQQQQIQSYDNAVAAAGNSTTTHEGLRININNQEKEVVLLIKWRGRSYVQCSWERPCDLEKFDPTGNTAKGKIKRYYQSQHTALGPNWRAVLEERRSIASSTTSHHHHHFVSNEAKDGNEKENNTNSNFGENNDDGEVEDEEFFQPDVLEVERILACDENSMDMKVLSRQRALNIKAEKEAEIKRQNQLLGDNNDKGGSAEGGGKEEGGRECQLSDAFSFVVKDEEQPWDPEDNVRYIVKWKGLQVSEVTWEYWLHIKHDCVDQAEDFWYRQKAPDPDKIKQNQKSHPTMRDYKKLTESPTFGLSSMKRPVMDLKDDDRITNNADSSQNTIEEEEATTTALKLRAYQLEGVNWLLWNWWNKRSCILADEMGLGKTIQTLGFLDQLQRLPASQVRGPFLIVAPLSLVNQWQSESATWAPDMNVILYHGSMDARNFLVEKEFYYTEEFVSKTSAVKLKRQHVTKFHILITTYEIVMKDLNILSKIRWKALVVDEAHRLKNHQSRLFHELGSVPRDFCLLLTGTPLQNSTEELWSLLNFSDPKAFASKDDFVDKFGQLSDSKQVSELHSVLRPYLLRRVKEDVEKSLPPKAETILEVTLTPIQKTYYKAIYEKNTSFLFKGSKPSNAPSLMNIMMELRKCCNHPFLIKGAEERIMAEAVAKPIADDENKDPYVRWHKLLEDKLVQSSGKMVIINKLLPKLQLGGHKVLIFSQMVKVLDLLEELLRLKKYNYERLDGSTRASARHAAVNRFNKKSYQRFVMLLSTRAGGLGLNLTSADTVIIFDSDWNPQNDLQAMARSHRIGQTRAVSVYRLLTAKTYEMHMFHSASMKLGLDRAVLAHQRQQLGKDENDPKKESKSEKESQAKEIDELLKKGAYDVFRDDDDTEAKKFMETDIDQILERSSRTVTYGDIGTSISKGLGSFSKASFVSSDVDGKDIDLDDPDFWAKAVGLDAPEEVIDENVLLMGEKRNRKQVQVFDPYASYAEEEQKKKDKVAQKVQQEKEEKKQMKVKKKVEKEEEKERKKKGRKVSKAAKEKNKVEKGVICASPKTKVLEVEGDRQVTKDKKSKKEMVVKRMRREEQKKLMRSIGLDDPITGQIKQGWEANHRDRVIGAFHRFGFGRFCKVRNEAALNSLPIQDLEVFLRSYIYQLGLQASVPLIESYELKSESFVKKFNSILHTCDGRWVMNAIHSSLKFFELSQIQERDVRIPQTLIQSDFVSRLRSGIALSSLHSLAFMTRFNRIVDNAVETIISELGKEELGTRGCYISDASTLDMDLKARHVTPEELSQIIGCYLSQSWKNQQLARWMPAPWWDYSCDLALIIGTFYHGLGNYQGILHDKSLPFSRRIHASSEGLDMNQAIGNFACVSKSATAVFVEAMSKQKEADKLVKLKQKEEKEKQESSEKIVEHEMNNEAPKADKVALFSTDTENPKSKNMHDIDIISSFMITLPELSRSIHQDLREVMKKSRNVENSIIKPYLPSSKCLDDRLHELVNLIEMTSLPKDSDGIDSVHNTPTSVDYNSIISKSFFDAIGLVENTKIPLQGPFYNALSNDTINHYDTELSAWSCMTTPKDHRGAAVPTIITRYGLAALVYTNEYMLNQVIETEFTANDSSNPTKPIDKSSSAMINTQAVPIEVISTPAIVKSTFLSDNNTSSETTHSSQSNKVSEIIPFQPQIHTVLQNDPQLRNGLCAALLCCGMPLCSSLNINDIQSRESFFQTSHLLQVAARIMGRNIFEMDGLLMDDTNKPLLSVKEMNQYLNDVLIPHCMRLCLFGKDYGIDSINKNEAETSNNDISSVSNKITEIMFSKRSFTEITHAIVLPDPLIHIQDHTQCSIEHAMSLLRRIKLSSAIQTIMCSCGDNRSNEQSDLISKDVLMQVLKSPKLTARNNSEVPIWWCPWLHDYALLQYASKFGLLTIIMDHNEMNGDESNCDSINTTSSRFAGTALDSSHLEIYIHKFLFEGFHDDDENISVGTEPFMPKHITDKASLEEMESVVEQELSQFPSVLVVEQRLSFICSEICKSFMSKKMLSSSCRNIDLINGDNFSWAYFEFPWFEHENWLRLS